MASVAPVALSATSSWGQKFPERPIHIVIPHPPGGPTDVIGRVYAQEVGRSIGQPMVVESRPGAAGATGAGEVARSPADGYTLLMNPSIQVIYSGLMKNLRFDPLQDFQPVALLGHVPLVAVVPGSAPYQSITDFVEAAKKSAGKLSYASPGHGSFSHLSGEVLSTAAGIRMIHVPYKGSAPAVNDLAGGHVDLMFAPLPTALPLVKAGRLRALAVTSQRRLAALPDLTTFAELGMPTLTLTSWYGVWAPKATPKGLVEQLNSAFRTAAMQERVHKVLTEQGTDPDPLSVAAFEQFVIAEHRRWSKVIRDAGIQPE